MKRRILSLSSALLGVVLFFAVQAGADSIPPLSRNSDHPDFQTIAQYCMDEQKKLFVLGNVNYTLNSLPDEFFEDNSFGLSGLANYPGKQGIYLPLRFHPGSRIYLQQRRGTSPGGYWRITFNNYPNHAKVTPEWVEDKPWTEGGEYNENDPSSIGHFAWFAYQTPTTETPDPDDPQRSNISMYDSIYIWLESGRMDGSGGSADSANPIFVPNSESRPDPIPSDSFTPTPHSASPLT